MFDAQAQARINKCCNDAAMGYFTAAGAAYLAMADQAFRFWSQSVEAMTPEPAKPARKSWYVAPDQAGRTRTERTSAEPTGAWACMMPWMAPTAMGPGRAAANQGPFGEAFGAWGLFEQWLSLTNPQTAMAWPMACGMMAVGVPQSVAWPTAQANVAAMDAFNTAAKSVEEAVVNYRSDGGHAVARIVTAR